MPGREERERGKNHGVPVLNRVKLAERVCQSHAWGLQKYCGLLASKPYHFTRVNIGLNVIFSESRRTARDQWISISMSTYKSQLKQPNLKQYSMLNMDRYNPKALKPNGSTRHEFLVSTYQVIHGTRSAPASALFAYTCPVYAQCLIPDGLTI